MWGLAYLGDRWERSVPFAGTSPYTGDVRVGDTMKTWQNDYRERRDELVDALGIGPGLRTKFFRWSCKNSDNVRFVATIQTASHRRVFE